MTGSPAHHGLFQGLEGDHLRVHRRWAIYLAGRAHGHQSRGHLFPQVFDRAPSGARDPRGLRARRCHPHQLQGRLHAELPRAQLRMTMAALMASNTPDTLCFVTLDPKLAAFNDLERSAYLWKKDAWWIPGNDRPASEVFDELIEEMDRRYQLTRQTGADNLRDHILATGKPLPRIVCVCDEYFALVSQSKEEGRAIEEAVAKLGAKARAAGIHLILATQQPSRKIINGNIQSNLPCRVALMLQSHIESTMILNSSGAERLTGSGDLLYRDFGDPVRLQAPYLPAEERAKWLKR